MTDAPKALAALRQRLDEMALEAPGRAMLDSILAALLDGRPADAAVRHQARKQQDRALLELRAKHFPGLKTYPAALAIETELTRYAASADQAPPRAGTRRRALFEVLQLGDVPSWQTLQRLFSKSPTI